MKKLNLLIVIVLGLILCFSCEKSKEETDAPKFTDYELIGAEHNKGLDYVFKYVKKRTSRSETRLKSTTDFLLLVEKGTQEFIKTNELFQSETNREIALKESKEPFIYYSSRNSSNLKSSTLENLWPKEKEYLLTVKQKEILTELNTFLSDPSLGVDEIETALNKLDLKIKSECKIEEMDVLLSATAIGRHSYQYWHDNLDKWISEFGSIYNLKNTKSFSWEDVWKNDVAYGVGGGAGGAIIGGSVSLGVLTLPGWAAGAIGGAVAGSVGNAVLQLLEKV